MILITGFLIAVLAGFTFVPPHGTFQELIYLFDGIMFGITIGWRS